MDADDLRRLHEVGTEERFAAGQVVIERGQYGQGLFVILDGTVVVNAPEGSRDLGPGAVIGERALLSDDGLRTARVRATSDLRLLVVDRARFDRICEEDPAFGRRLADAAAAEPLA